MNEGDQSQINEEFALKVAMTNHKSKAATTFHPFAAGRCWNCSEGFPANDNRLFCDTDCQDDYEARQAAYGRKHGA